MSANTAELTLIIKARNLAETELAKVRGALDKITVTAKIVASDVAGAFKDVGHRIGRYMGNIATDLLTGGDLTRNMIYLGATMAGAMVEGLAAHFIPAVLARIAATSFFAPIVATFATAGVTAGTVFDAAVAVTMAALPFVLLGIAVAALVYLITNPEARQRAHDAALMILGAIGDGLRGLGKLMYDNFMRGLGRVGDALRDGMAEVERIARKVAGNIEDIIMAIPRAIEKALRAIGVLNDTPVKYAGDLIPKTPGHAEGGWVGLHGPELSWVGEKGPEYIVPNHQLNRSAGDQGDAVRLVGVSKRDIQKIVDEGLYFQLRRSTTTLGRKTV